MFDIAIKHFTDCDGAILAAAVADFTPSNTHDEKLKKDENNKQLTITLKQTQDILGTLGKMKQHQKLVGFALETNNEVENAKTKLKKKNLDFIVLNSLKDKGSGFQSNTNKITIIDKNENMLEFDLKDKRDVAHDIVNCFKDLFN